MARVVTATDAATLERRTRDGFRARFGRDAALCSSAPGRVNLIGEHTDYNDGFVLPMAIARRTAVAVSPRQDRHRRHGHDDREDREDRVVRVGSAAFDGLLHLHLDEGLEGRQPGEPRWGDYVRGVLAECVALGLDPGGFDAWIDSDVPVGAGLSSSAALEVALAGAVEQLAGRALEPVAKARLCCRAEQGYAGVPCGLMDQMASVLAGDDALLFLDCRDLSWQRLALPADQVQLLVVDSQLPHDLGQGEFARRVQQCRDAANALGVASLRDATRERVGELADPLLRARARHVVEENARVLAAVDAVRTNDWSSLGRLMDESHASLRDLYEVSRPEMDELVEELRRGGALGARMTGGGFGGCAVALFPAGAAVPERLGCADTPGDG